MDRGELMIFAPNSGREHGEQICSVLDMTLSSHEERDFEDGEHKIRSLVNVRGRDVFVVSSLNADQQYTANDRLCRLLFFLGSLGDASAGHVTAVVPYLCYSRKDRKSKPRDPVTTRYVARMFEAVGVDRVVTLDVHNLAAFQNAFRQPTDHLEAMKLFVEHFAPLVKDTRVAVVSPDSGGVKRARIFQDALAQHTGSPVTMGFMEKQRSGGVVSGDAFVGDVKGRNVIIIDDLISSGTTLVRAAKACYENGAHNIYAAATHGAFGPDAAQVLGNPLLKRIVVTNSVTPSRLPEDFLAQKVTVLDVAPLIAEAIHRIHEGGSLVELLDI
jgi:ribose-phosphate pyrophosphokinase